eukprot:GHVP01063343.1.p1 GENE.GHVP01063343.1~~GHVP01063343.1.p1  ORF type:complete len:122 (+),score=13.54 GHVP01063343.1:140-505(+)
MHLINEQRSFKSAQVEILRVPISFYRHIRWCSEKENHKTDTKVARGCSQLTKILGKRKFGTTTDGSCGFVMCNVKDVNDEEFKTSSASSSASIVDQVTIDYNGLKKLESCFDNPIALDDTS